MLQGMTAHYLTHSTFPLNENHVALVHAAAGGTGRLVVQMAKLLGARVIATVGSEEKAQIAREAGADETILYREKNFAEETRRLTGGAGVDVVYDSVGADTFERSIDSLKIRGMMVSFGNASGPVPPFSPLLLAQKGSLFLTRPTLAQYIVTREELDWRAGDLFTWLASGKLKLMIDHVYPLAEAAQSHRDWKVAIPAASWSWRSSESTRCDSIAGIASLPLRPPKGSHRAFHHPVKPMVVTVPGNWNDDLPVGTPRSILKKAELKP